MTTTKTTSSTKTKTTEPELDENLVADFLNKHPDYFQNRDSLLLKMNIPHEQGGAVSLIEKQVSLLRDKQKENRKKLEEYVQMAKQNDAVFTKCQRLILALLDAEDGEDFFNALEHSFRRDFKSTAYSLVVFGDEPRQINHFTSIISEASAAEYIGALMKSKKPTLGALRPTEQDFLFRHQSEKVKSAAVLPVLGDDGRIALLAIGHKDANYFQPGMGTLFIGFIADVLARLLPKQVSI